MKNWEVILFVGVGFQGVLLSVLLFIDRRSRSNATKILSILMFAFSLELFNYAILWTYNFYNYFRLGYVTYGFTLAYGPLLLLYLKKRFQRSYTANYYWHFLLYFLQTAVFVPFYFMDKETTITGMSHLREAGLISSFEYLSVIVVAFYTSLIWQEVRSILSGIRPNLSDSALLRAIAWIFTFYAITYSMYFLIDYFTGSAREHKYLISGGMSLSIYLMGYLGYFKPDLVGKPYLRKYRNTPINKAVASEKIDELMKLINIDHIHLDSSTSLPTTAKKLNISNHQLSQLINENLNLSFSDLMNTKRVDTAKVFFTKPEYANERLESIGYLSGFNSKTSFYQTFKKVTGKTPSEYKESLKEFSTF